MRQLWLFSFSLLFLLAGCATTKLSPQQRRSLQVKHFKDSSYNNVFRAFKTVLQDEGYIIKNQDMDGGLIVAHSSKPIHYEVSVNLEEINKKYVESRVIIQQVYSYSQGDSQRVEILSPELYKNIYTKVFTEVARRKAQGK